MLSQTSDLVSQMFKSPPQKDDILYLIFYHNSDFYDKID